MDLVPLLEEELREIGAILARDARHQRSLCHGRQSMRSRAEGEASLGPYTPVMVAARYPLISVLVVSHNVRDLLRDTLRSVRNEGWPNLQVVVVDNASVDGSADMAHREFPEVEVIALDHNLGFGGANNLAFEHANGDLILLLNPDVTVVGGCIGNLARFLEAHADAGAVGPRLVRPDGRPDLAARRSFPTPAASLYRVTGLSRLFPSSARFNRYNLGA